MAVKKGGESCRVDGSGGGLADVLITEFLISNISQKRGEGNESGRADRGLSNGEAERISSRDPLRPKAMPSQTQLFSRVISTSVNSDNTVQSGIQNASK